MQKLFLCSYFKATFDIFTREFGVMSGKNICFIPTAANVEEVDFYVDEALEIFKKGGANVAILDVANAKAKEIEDKIFTCDIIYVSGGNSFFLLNAMRKSGADNLIKAAINAGKIYIGESAGAALLSPDISYMQKIDDKGALDIDDFVAFGAINFYTLVHFKSEPFAVIADEIYMEFKDKSTLKTIQNDEAIVIKDDKIKQLKA